MNYLKHIPSLQMALNTLLGVRTNICDDRNGCVGCPAYHEQARECKIVHVMMHIENLVDALEEANDCEAMARQEV